MARGSHDYWRRRARRHAALAAASTALFTLILVNLSGRDPIHDVSLASGYVGLALLGASLAIGPWNVLRGRPNPVSTDLRRDVGIWAGIVGLFHLAIGLNVHLRGRPWLYFVYPADEARALPIRHDLFGFANETGLAAGLALLLLLALSNDRSLARLRPRRWKSLQRLNYWGAALVVAHSIAYQVIENRLQMPALLLAFAAVVAATAALQAMGFHRTRARGDGAVRAARDAAA